MTGSNGGIEVEMSGEGFGFSAPQWELLKRAPLHVLAHVGGADATIDAAEWGAFLEAVSSSSGADDALVRTVLGELAADLAAGEHADFDADPLASLTEVRDIVGAWSAEGLGLRTALMEIGATIAASSGRQLTMTYASRQEAGGGWRLSSGLSREEQAALDAAAVALNLAVSMDAGAAGTPEPVGDSSQS
jgi:hypothetical protein